MSQGRTEIPGSAPEHAGASSHPRSLPAEEQLSATIVLRRRPDSAQLGEQLLSGHLQPLSGGQAAQITSAAPQDVDAVEAFAREHGLRVTEADAAKRVVKVTGHPADFNRAFGVQLELFGNHISYNGPISVPDSLGGMIVAVLGLDTRPAARPRADVQASDFQ